MPKEPKKKKMSSSTSGGASSKSAAAAVTRERHAPLGQVIQDDIHRNKFATRKVSGSAFSRGRTSNTNNNDDDDDDDDVEEEGMMLDEKTSRRILDIAHEQRQEMELLEMKQGSMTSNFGGGLQLKTKSKGTTRRKQEEEDSSDDDEEDDDEEEEEEKEEEEMMVNHDTESGYVSMGSAKAIGLTPEEEALLSNMMGRRNNSNNNNNNEDDDDDYDEDGGMTKSRNLADIIMAKIEEKEAMAHHQRRVVTSTTNNNNNNNNDDNNDEGQSTSSVMQLPPKVIQVYTDIGKLLTHYTSGKLPKAFKVLPSLHNWEEVLYLTNPQSWTPQAMYAATRIFASNLNPKMAQRFYNVILLDSVRADIHTNRKLNYHYYMSLKKAVYKPAAFFKGIVLPLCSESAYCTLREAIIIASVLQKVSIPVHHSAVAIHKLATMSSGSSTYNGASSIFMRTLLDKKYSLPAPVIDSLIAHFVRFMDTTTTTDNNNGGGTVVGEESLPVLWHQALLVFVQRYKNDINIHGKEQLRDLMKVHYHPKITVEIRRELFGSAAWREERGDDGTGATTIGGGNSDDVMVM
jgi:essential nuclear protein 1